MGALRFAFKYPARVKTVFWSKRVGSLLNMGCEQILVVREKVVKDHSTPRSSQQNKIENLQFAVEHFVHPQRPYLAELLLAKGYEVHGIYPSCFDVSYRSSQDPHRLAFQHHGHYADRGGSHRHR